jgi:hypothetical protein
LELQKAFGTYVSEVSKFRFPGELFHLAQKPGCLIGRILRNIFNEV